MLPLPVAVFGRRPQHERLHSTTTFNGNDNGYKQPRQQRRQRRYHSTTATATPTDGTTTTTTTGSYFEAGKTNHVEADFEGVECGCAGRTISQSSGSGDYSSSAIAIATLAALVALLLLVCMCLVHLKKRKALTHNAGKI